MMAIFCVCVRTLCAPQAIALILESIQTLDTRIIYQCSPIIIFIKCEQMINAYIIIYIHYSGTGKNAMSLISIKKYIFPLRNNSDKQEKALHLQYYDV